MANGGERTASQKEANEFDLELFRLWRRSADASEMTASRTPQDWATVSSLLSQARAIVRRFMHEEDRRRTNGNV